MCFTCMYPNNKPYIQETSNNSIEGIVKLKTLRAVHQLLHQVGSMGGG